MKICIQTLGILAIAASLSYGQDAPKKEGRKQPDPEKLFKKLDSDGNGSISLDEFKASPRGQKDPAKAEEGFKRIDTDGSGGISPEELKSHKPNHAPGKHKKKGGNNGQ